MNHYGYFGAAAPGLSLESGTGTAAAKHEARPTAAYLSMISRERATAPTFGAKCDPIFLPATWEAVYDITALASSDSCSGLSRLKYITGPLRALQEANTRAIEAVLDDRYSYGWLIWIFRSRYNSVVSRADRAKEACAAANEALDAAIGTLENVVVQVESAQSYTIPFLREAALRWCNNPPTYIPMERDICSDVRTRREMMRGRKPGVYQSWKKSCDIWQEKRTRTGAVTDTYGWPRKMDEESCHVDAYTGWSMTDGCPFPPLPHGGKYRRELYEQGCFISESCYDPYGFRVRAQSVRNMANNAIGLFNDSSSLFYNVITAIEEALDASERASITLGSALNALYKKVKNRTVKSTIIAAATAVTVGAATGPITMAYNRMQRGIKDSRNSVRALPPTFREALAEYHSLKEGGWDTAAGCSGGWEEAAEDQARRIRTNMDAMLSAIDGLTPACSHVYPSRTTEGWAELGVEATCPAATGGLVGWERTPRLDPRFPKGGGSSGGDGIPGVPGGVLRTEGIYGGYGAIPEKTLGLTKQQWLVVGVLGAAVYYYKGRE